MKIKTAPRGCGKMIGNNTIACGDHIDLEDDKVQPVLCDMCWDKFRAEDKLK